MWHALYYLVTMALLLLLLLLLWLLFLFYHYQSFVTSTKTVKMCSVSLHQVRFGNQRSCSYTLPVITAETSEAGLYMVNMSGCTFLWLKLLIVEPWVLARYIFSVCVMFSLLLWMGSVYCELPLEDLLWDQISLTRWFLLARLLHTFTYSILLVRVCFFFFFQGAPSVMLREASQICQSCCYQS